jgi:hypothetical protein
MRVPVRRFDFVTDLTPLGKSAAGRLGALLVGVNTVEPTVDDPKPDWRSPERMGRWY